MCTRSYTPNVEDIAADGVLAGMGEGEEGRGKDGRDWGMGKGDDGLRG